MIEIPQWLINFALSAASGLAGWAAKTLWDAQRKLTEEMKELELLVVGKYVTNERFEQTIAALFAKLDRIYEKLTEKADK